MPKITYVSSRLCEVMQDMRKSGLSFQAIADELMLHGIDRSYGTIRFHANGKCMGGRGQHGESVRNMYKRKAADVSPRL